MKKLVPGIALASAIAIVGSMLPRGSNPLGPSAVAAGGGSFATEKVIVVMVDGLRLSESYKAPSSRASFLGPNRPVDFTSAFTNVIAPQGTLYTNARTGVTNSVTTPCTNNIVTGQWHEGPNRGRGIEIEDGEYVDNRSLARTIFERARDELALPPTKVGFVTDKLNTRLSDYGYHPAGGPSLGPTYIPFEPRFNNVEPEGDETYIDPDDNSMRDVLVTTFDLMDTSSPDLLFVGLGLVDIAGHRAIANGRNDFEFYVDAIRVWDEVFLELWQGIQARADYRDKSTLILVSDHGRHDDHDAVAYGSHSGTCDGIRDLMLFVVGPDTPAGLVVDRRAFQVDVAPTVARLLGFDLPESTGRPLWEAMGDTTGFENPIYLRGTRATLDDEGTVHAVSRRASASGDFEIVIRSAPSDGPFGPARVLARENRASARFLDHPDIVAAGDEVEVAAWRWNEDDREVGWNHEIVGWRSVDRAATFPTEPDVIVRGRSEDSTDGFTSLAPFDLSFTGGEKTMLLPTVRYSGYGNEALMIRFAGPTLSPISKPVTEDVISDVRRLGYHSHQDIVEASDGTLYATWSALLLPSDLGRDPLRATWDVLVKDLTRTEGGDTSWRITDNDLDADVQPALAIDREGAADRLGVVFAKRDEANGFQLFTTESTDLQSGTFQPLARLTNPPSRAWEPDAVFAAGLLHVVYTSYAPGKDGEIFYIPVLHGNPVDAPMNLSRSGGLESRNPTLLLDEARGLLQILWEEERPGGGFGLEKRTIAL